jgi:cytochrome c
MDSFELNKVAGAVLGTLLLAIGSGFVAELIYSPKPAGNAGYALPEPQPEAAGGGAAAAAVKAEPLPVRLASASVEKGTGAAKKCAACHSFEKGGPNKVGPHLWGVVDRQRAHESGFEYSAALKEKGGTWTYDELDHFLANPKTYVPGTKMAFAGIQAPQERADVIAYLRSLADTPAPLPAVEKAASADDKPAAERAPEEKPAQ